MGHRFTYVVSPEEERENLTVEWFLRRHGYSRHIITGLKRTEDGIFRNGVRAWTSQAVHAGDVIETHLVETEPSDGILPRPVPFSVVYEDDDILVVDKPADTPIHPSIGNYENTLANALAYRFASRGEHFVFRAVNRLDRDTTGLLLIAKHKISGAFLSAMTAKKEIRREYLAIVAGKPEKSGTIDLPIARKDSSTIERCIDMNHGEHAVTHYRCLDYRDDLGCSLVRLRLETGRTHQIRVHMAWIGHPLFNDERYGGDRILKGTTFAKYRQFIENCFAVMPRHALHARLLGFEHPATHENVLFESPLPADFQSLLTKWNIYTSAAKETKEN